MRLLDLFCGAGGAAMGYHRAGFTEIVGVDNRPQKRYPFEFVQADAIEYALEHGREFDAIHASPPCQAYSKTRHIRPAKVYPKLLEPTRDALQRIGQPYVIENVEGAPMHYPIRICAQSLGLPMYRHRLFESSHPLLAPAHMPHRNRTTASSRHGKPRAANSLAVFQCVAGWHSQKAAAAEAMGIDWMTRDEMTQAIPPAYTLIIGIQLLQQLQEEPPSLMKIS